MPQHREVENATWEIVHTISGPHVRLVGANGEIVLWSQVYADTETAVEAIRIARRAVGPTRIVNPSG